MADLVRDRGRSQSEVYDAVRLRLMGLSWSDIADALGVPMHTISGWRRTREWGAAFRVVMDDFLGDMLLEVYARLNELKDNEDSRVALAACKELLDRLQGTAPLRIESRVQYRVEKLGDDDYGGGLRADGCVEDQGHPEAASEAVGVLEIRCAV